MTYRRQCGVKKKKKNDDDEETTGGREEGEQSTVTLLPKHSSAQPILLKEWLHG